MDDFSKTLAAFSEGGKISLIARPGVDVFSFELVGLVGVDLFMRKGSARGGADENVPDRVWQNYS